MAHSARRAGAQSKRAGWLTKTGYRSFVKYYKVDMTEAKPDTASHRVRSMISLFVRCDDVRPLNTDPNILG